MLMSQLRRMEVLSENGWSRVALERLLAEHQARRQKAEDELRVAEESIRIIELEIATLPAKRTS
jgi:hypothetical protein